MEEDNSGAAFRVVVAPNVFSMRQRVTILFQVRSVFRAHTDSQVVLGFGSGKKQIVRYPQGTEILIELRKMVVSSQKVPNCRNTVSLVNGLR
jgi:hypothetical protein